MVVSYQGEWYPTGTTKDSAVITIAHWVAVVFIISRQHAFVIRKAAYRFEKVLNKTRKTLKLATARSRLRTIMASAEDNSRGDWVEVCDMNGSVLGKSLARRTVYYNCKTYETRLTKPSGWASMQAQEVDLQSRVNEQKGTTTLGKEATHDLTKHLPKLKPSRKPGIVKCITAFFLSILGLTFLVFTIRMIDLVSCPPPTSDVFDGCLVVGYPLFVAKAESASCPCLAYRCKGKPLTNDNCLAAAVKQFGEKVTAARSYQGPVSYINAAKGCGVHSTGDWAAYFNTYDGTSDGQFTEVRRDPAACTGFQTVTFDRETMVSLEFDTTLLNTSDANSLATRFPNMRELRLKSNGLKKFQPVMSPKLERLTLEGNKLTLFEMPAENFPSMRSLHLRNNELTEVPSDVWGLANLVTLWTSNNRLATLPSELSRLSLLKTLWVNDNVLTVLPPELGALRQLTDLRVQDNRLVRLPSELGSLIGSLMVVDLQRNMLQCKVRRGRCAL